MEAGAGLADIRGQNRAGEKSLTLRSTRDVLVHMALTDRTCPMCQSAVVQVAEIRCKCGFRIACEEIARHAVVP